MGGRWLLGDSLLPLGNSAGLVEIPGEVNGCCCWNKLVARAFTELGWAGVSSGVKDCCTRGFGLGGKSACGFGLVRGGLLATGGLLTMGGLSTGVLGLGFGLLETGGFSALWVPSLGMVVEHGLVATGGLLVSGGLGSLSDKDKFSVLARARLRNSGVSLSSFSSCCTGRGVLRSCLSHGAACLSSSSSP